MTSTRLVSPSTMAAAASAGSLGMPRSAAHVLPVPPGTTPMGQRRMSFRAIMPLTSSCTVPSPPMPTSASRGSSVFASCSAWPAYSVRCTATSTPAASQSPMKSRSVLQIAAVPPATSDSSWTDTRGSWSDARAMIQSLPMLQRRPSWFTGSTAQASTAPAAARSAAQSASSAAGTAASDATFILTLIDSAGSARPSPSTSSRPASGRASSRRNRARRPSSFAAV
mmetsp:Transcript_13536/g.46457  ORF Transcript_13536/g.46457 Transcript_13536/m.46457 type:complete len:225 (+) Transcript_13536:305-979(+)